MDNARRKRKQLLRKLLFQIMHGKYNSNKATPNEMFPDSGTPARQEFVSPDTRQSVNYGYMETKEMSASDPNSW